ncbi:hypothetical protein PRZ48_014358, partial [Zasmidium cellare]
MSAAVKSVAPSHASSKHSSRSSSKASSSHSGANRTVNDVIERIHAAETRSVRPRSHAGSLVLARPQDRPIDDINAEIAALEAEARARHLERKAESERELAMSIRAPEYDIVEERQVIRRPREEEIVLFERDRVERRKSPPRNVVRVEKDRKGRMSL